MRDGGGGRGDGGGEVGEGVRGQAFVVPYEASLFNGGTAAPDSGGLQRAAAYGEGASFPPFICSGTPLVPYVAAVPFNGVVAAPDPHGSGGATRAVNGGPRTVCAGVAGDPDLLLPSSGANSFLPCTSSNLSPPLPSTFESTALNFVESTSRYNVQMLSQYPSGLVPSSSGSFLGMVASKNTSPSGSLQSLLHQVSSVGPQMGAVGFLPFQVAPVRSINDGDAQPPLAPEKNHEHSVYDYTSESAGLPISEPALDHDSGHQDSVSGTENDATDYEADVEGPNDRTEEEVPDFNPLNLQNPATEDASLQYEFFSTALGDSGYVSTSAAYQKRKRVPKGTTMPDCRPPRAMGTIEKAMRNAKNRTTTHIFEPVLGMVFDSKAEAYNFYNLYSWEVGFGIRFGTSTRNQVNKRQTKQEIVCEKQGFDARCTNSSKRSHCKAMIRLHRTEDDGWYVSHFVSEHNHPLSVSCGEKREWNSHSKIEQCTKDMICYLRENNVSLSRVHCILGSMYGSIEDVPFNQKSLRAVCAQIARDQKDDDVGKTLEVFRKMRAADPGFQFSVALDDEKKIKTLLWTSGRSRSQYHFFGDAITFDTTYCTNIYKMPFGMFVGVNNHFQSVLYAGVLMRNETTESFKWVFKEFLEIMGRKAPITILTDQCKAMTNAIKEVFPNTNHFWCKWHVFKDAPEELGPVYRRNGPFRKEFHYVINEMLTEDEFEMAWDDLLERYQLREHPFMVKTYNKRNMWAKPWAKNKFCARMASTQRSESANSLLKRVIPRNSSMNRFVQQYRKLLTLRSRAEQKAEHETKQFELRARRVYAIERHAFKLYTKNCYLLFSAEVDKAAQYVVVTGDTSNSYKVIHNNADVRKKWARVVFSVVVQDDGEHSCECGLYQHFGILCCHAIKVMIHCGVSKIPEAHIMKRWTRNARDFSYADDISGSGAAHPSEGLVFVNALEVASMANKDARAGTILMKYLAMARKEIESLQEEQFKESGYEDTSGYISSSSAQGEDAYTSGYDSDGEPIAGNMYGAAGSSAHMSDNDIQKIQAPTVPPNKGRPRANRFPRMFEKWKKGRKRTILRFCDRCNEEGHLPDTCKLKPIASTKKKGVATRKRRTQLKQSP